MYVFWKSSRARVGLPIISVPGGLCSCPFHPLLFRWPFPLFVLTPSEPPLAAANIQGVHPHKADNLANASSHPSPDAA